MFSDAFAKVVTAIAATMTVIVATVSLLVASGCSATHSQATSPPQDIFGETQPIVDAAKANLPLNEIPPAVHPPQTASGSQPPLPDRAQHALTRAAELRAERRFTDATIELEKALRYAPDRSETHRALALILWDAGNTDRARAQIDEALDSEEDDLICHYLRGRLAARRFDNARAIQELRLALLCTVRPETEAFKTLTQYYLAEALAAEGYLRAAIYSYTRFREEYEFLEEHGALNLDTTAPAERAALRAAARSVHENTSQAFAALGDYESAAKHLRLAHADQPMSAAVRVTYAKILARGGHLEEAAREARAAFGEDEDAVAALTSIRAAQGNPTAILDDLRQACDEHPDDVTLLMAYTDALIHHQRSAEARSILQARVQALPEEDALRWRLFDLLRDEHAWNAALDLAAEAVQNRSEIALDAAAKITSLAKTDEGCSVLSPTSPDSEQVPATDFAHAYVRGILAGACGDETTAAKYLKTAINVSQTFMPARIALARIYVRDARWTDVIATVSPDAPSLPTDTRVEFLLGLAYRGLDQLDKAEKHFSNASLFNRTNTEAMLALAELYNEVRQPDRAMRQLEKLVRSDPLNEAAREMLFDAFLSNGDHRAAEEQLAELRRIKAAPTRIARCVARLEYDIDRPDAEERYRKILQDAIDAYRPDAETLRLIASSFERERRYEPSIAHLKEALKLDPAHMKILEQLERCYRLNLRFEKALALARRMLAKRPNHLQWKGEILDLLIVLQRFDQAIEYAQELLTTPNLDTGMVNALQGTLVQIHQMRNDFPKAITILDAWHKREPEDIVAYHMLVAACQKAKLNERAMELLRTWATKFTRGFAAIALTDVWAALQPGQVDEALQLVLTQLENDPDNDGLQITLIDLLRSAKRFEEAIDLAQNNGAAGRSAEFYQLELLRTYEAAGRFDDAIALLTKMRGESGHDRTTSIFASRQLELELAQVLIVSGKYRKAAKKINRWLENAGTNEDRLLYLRTLVSCQQEAGDDEEAIQTLSLALELAPDDIGLQNDLGYALADLGQDLDRAKELVRYAVAREPRNSAYLDSLGWVLYKRGELEGAKTWLTRARFAGEGEDPVVCDHLADACWRLGNREAARKWWQESLVFAQERLDTPAPRVLDQKTRDAVRAKLDAVEAGEEPAIAPVVPVALTAEGATSIRAPREKVLD